MQGPASSAVQPYGALGGAVHGGPGVLCGGPGMQFVMRMRSRAHVQTTSTSARHGVMVIVLGPRTPKVTGAGLMP